MNKDQKIVVFGLTLAGSLGALWYFSTRRIGAQTSDASSTVVSQPSNGSTPDASAFTFNLPPLTVPPITIPKIGSTHSSSPDTGSCCRNCGGNFAATPGPGPSSKPVSPAVSSNTQSGAATSPTVDHSHIFEPLLVGNDGALPRPNPVLWTEDKLYRLAYVLSWNDNVKNANDACWSSSRHGYVCHLGTIDDSLANNSDLSAIEAATFGNATAILKSSPGDPLYTAMMQSMSVYLNQFGDTSINTPKQTKIGSGLTPL